MSVRTGVDEYNLPTSDINSGYVGEIKMFGFSGVPAHCLACDGSAVSRTTYAALFAAIGTTWGAGDGSSTFNLPDLRGEWVQGAGTNAVGADIAEGLPNIWGHQDSDYHFETADAYGAFYFLHTSTSRPTRETVSSDAPADLGFDASRANAIYGASDHVTPKSKALKACIIYE